MNKIITILGKKGTGKTTKANELITHWRHTKRVLIFDTMNEYEYPDFETSEFLDSSVGVSRISPLDFSDDKLGFELVMDFAFATGNMVLVIDEIDMYCSTMRVPFSLTKLYRYGRHKNIDIIGISRRPSDIPRIATAMTDIFYLFRIQEPRDLIYLNSLQEGLGEKVKNLENFNFIFFQA